MVERLHERMARQLLETAEAIRAIEAEALSGGVRSA
jgi:hypothetical protein